MDLEDFESNVPEDEVDDPELEQDEGGEELEAVEPAEAAEGDDAEEAEEDGAEEGAEASGEDEEGEAAEEDSDQEDSEDKGKLNVPEKATIKVDGEEREVQLPQTQDELLQLVSRAEGADARFREAAEHRKTAAQTKKQYTSLVEALQSRPADVLRAAGHDLDKMAEQVVLEKLKREQMDPNDRRKLELDEQEQRLKAQQEEQRKSLEKQQLQARSEAYTRALAEAAEAAGLPTHSTLLWERMQNAAMERYPDDDPDPEEFRKAAPEIIEAVRARYYEEVPSLLKNLDAAKLKELLGEERMAELAGTSGKKADPKEAPKATNPPKSKRGVRASGKVASKPKRRGPRTLDEIEDELEERYG